MAGSLERSQDEAGGQDRNDGLSSIDLLNIPEGLASVVNRIIRRNGMRLEDIAKEMGIHFTTVSKALRNHPDISKQTKDKIIAVARSDEKLKKLKEGFPLISSFKCDLGNSENVYRLIEYVEAEHLD